mmetsp:Transcript_2445/g.6263  ORF Transcript_2445/g.6263 Transcript_2445/m.6263 type:complete len:202 (+) Transcript_2445:357-962(+)
MASAAMYLRILATCSSTERLDAPPSVSRISALRLKSHTCTTSSLNSGWMLCRSLTVRSLSAHPRVSAILTAEPEMWCVSLKGTPLRTRYSARSVASMSADRPFIMRSGRMLSVDMTPVAMRTQSYTVSTVSYIISQHSWKSLLYVVGVPFTTASTPARLPCTRPALPLMSSSASGFFFCGMSDDPVAYASLHCTNPNWPLL